MTVVKIIAFIVFAISCAVIYHNTNSYEPAKRIGYIAVGTIIMYIVTSIVGSIATSGINVKSDLALKDILVSMQLLFTPINSMIVFATLGNIFGKLKDKAIDTDKAGKRIIIMIAVFIVLLIIEASYIGGFTTDMLGT